MRTGDDRQESCDQGEAQPQGLRPCFSHEMVSRLSIGCYYRRIEFMYIDHAEARRDLRVEERDPFSVNQIEQLLRLVIRHDEFDFNDGRSAELQWLGFGELVVASEPLHGPKRRAAANVELVAMDEQPFPDGVVAMAPSLMDVESEK